MKRKPLWVASACKMHTVGVWSPFQVTRLGDGSKPHRLRGMLQNNLSGNIYKGSKRRQHSTLNVSTSKTSLPIPINVRGIQHVPCHVTVLL